MTSIAVIDYGMGNLHSVASALQHVADGVEVHVTADAGIIEGCERVIFPGVGAIRECLEEIRKAGLEQAIIDAAACKPFLGICLGMQLLLDHSEENSGTDCLGIIPGNVKYFGDNLVESVSGERLKVPHMGWNQVRQCQYQGQIHPLWQGIEDNSRFYFVHSYYVAQQDPDLTAGSCHYGIRY